MMRFHERKTNRAFAPLYRALRSVFAPIVSTVFFSLPGQFSKLDLLASVAIKKSVVEELHRLETTMKQSERDSNSGPPESDIQNTRPRCLPFFIFIQFVIFELFF